MKMIAVERNKTIDEERRKLIDCNANQEFGRFRRKLKKKQNTSQKEGA